MQSRRTFVRSLLQTSVALASQHHLKLYSQQANHSSLKLSKSPAIEVPANFTGLGYEMSSVAEPGLLDPANSRYINLVRGLGPQGVLRLGGIVANYTRYIPNGTAEHDRTNTVITRACLERLAAFLHRVGWTAIWSVNFAQGTIDQAVAEARAVSNVLGAKLLAIEIGNEVDSYGKGQPFRPSSYDYETYRKEYDKWYNVIAKAIPGLRFAAPDTTPRAVDWTERMADDAHGEVQLLTTHYYRNGQARGSAEQLLTPDPKLNEMLAGLRAASRRSGIPWRICEINSFSGGGKPGVSDTFIGALWTLHTMLLLAQDGCAGVNIETGVNQLGFVSSYSPIQDDGKGINSAGVPYYGMLAFANAFAGCHQLMPLESASIGESTHVYVLGAQGKPRNVVIINMDSSTTAHASLAGLNIEHANVLRLLAPAPDSKTGVTFGGTSVDARGHWNAVTRERITNGNVSVPPMTAAVIVAAHGT